MRDKRVRQYAKVYRYCHKRLADCHVKTRREYESLGYVYSRSMVAVFNRIGKSSRDAIRTIREVR